MKGTSGSQHVSKLLCKIDRRGLTNANGIPAVRLGDRIVLARDKILVGPSVRHFHLPTPRAFGEKCVAVARASAALAKQLDALYGEVTGFWEPEIELLKRAGLLTTPDLTPVPPFA